MALGPTQLLTEVSAMNLLGKGQPAHNAENLTIICKFIVYKV
jgi:hypothetical protein